MRYKVLGPFEVRRDDADLTPTAPRLREILALLVVRHNHVVTVRELVDELWGASPPTTAVPTLQTYVYRLRRLFVGPRPTRGEGALRTKGDGYLLDIRPDEVDLHHFTSLTGQGRVALGAGDAERASRLCAKALDLWSGETALGGVTAGDLLSAHITRLAEMRLRAIEIRIEADLRLGEHRELISELKGLILTYPLHEAFYGQLMLALYRANRCSEALSTYRRLRELMIGELGLEPSARLRELQQALLSGDSSLDLAPQEQKESPQVTLIGPIGPPAQLPPDIPDFVGRVHQLRFTERLLCGDGAGTPSATPVLSVTGMPGIGKTALAVHLAHRARASYPDGQLFAEFGDTTRRPAEPAEVLGRFLRALGLPDKRIPADLDERTTLFRTLTADRRVLVVLDNAVSARQVLPLLPGGDRCGVLITSRRRFSGIAAAHQLEVPPLAAEEAHDLLGKLVGQARVAAEPGAARRVVMLCGHLPLAIRGVAARLAAAGPESLLAVGQRLLGRQGRFEELRFGEFDLGDRLRTALSTVDGELRDALTGLARVEAPTFTLSQAMEVLGRDEPDCRRLVIRLVEVNLLRVTGHETPVDPRYCFHPLVRLYVRDQLATGLAELAGEVGGETIALLPVRSPGEPAVAGNGSHLDLSS